MKSWFSELIPYQGYLTVRKFSQQVFCYLVIEMLVTDDELLEVDPGVTVPVEVLFEIVIPPEVAV